MTTPGDTERRDINLTVIRDHLNEKFPDCEVKGEPDKPLGHWFTVTDLKIHKCFKLWISRPLLEDTEYTPERTAAALKNKDIAGKMKATEPEAYSWWPDPPTRIQLD